MKPRDYQIAAIKAVRKVWDAGDPNALVVMATGLGKTVLFAHVGEELRAEGLRKILVIAHRRELITQARDKWRKVEPDRRVGVYMGARRDITADVICASIQSCYPDIRDEDGNLVRKGRIAELPAHEIDLVIFDEVHHAISDTYLALLDHIRAANPHMLMLGVTATAIRGDGRGLGHLFNRTAYTMGIQRGIHAGWLAPAHAMRVELDVDLADVKTGKGGDFQDKDLGRVMDSDEVRREIVTAWEKHAADRRTVVFCPTVKTSTALAAAFAEAGHAAEHLDGGTPKAERDAILARYDAGTTQIVVNCAVLTEGWDAPATDCVLIARPTKSVGLLVQMIGRGTRLAPGKTNCIVMGCAGALDNVKIASMLDLANHLDEKMAVVEPEEPEPEPEDKDVLFELPLPETKTVVRGHRVYEVDLFDGAVHWGRVGSARVTSLGKGRNVAIVPVGDGYRVFECWYPKHGDADPPLTWITDPVTLGEAFYVGNLHATENGDGRFLRPNGWHQSQPITPKARGVIYRLVRWLNDLGEKIPGGVVDGNINDFSRAQASYVAAYLTARLAWALEARSKAA